MRFGGSQSYHTGVGHFYLIFYTVLKYDFKIRKHVLSGYVKVSIMVLKRRDKSPSAYRTIGEAAEDLSLAPHILRFWESRFSQLRPMKRTGGRRYYSPRDLKLLSGIKTLLYEEEYSIKQAQAFLSDRGLEGMLTWVEEKEAERTENHKESHASSPSVSPKEPPSSASYDVPKTEQSKTEQLRTEQLKKALMRLEHAYACLQGLQKHLHRKA